jgi:hypothetical protein
MVRFHWTCFGAHSSSEQNSKVLSLRTRPTSSAKPESSASLSYERAEIVVDASLALKWVVEEPFSLGAISLLDEWRSHRRKLLAPALFLYEVTDALAKRIQRDQLTLSNLSRGCASF